MKDKFRKAAKYSRISKTDQLETLRVALTGNDASRIPPDGVTSVDNARSILEKAFGNSFEHLYFHLRVMKAAQPLSDKSMETDPNEAATWFLQYENDVKSILRLGDRTTSLGMESFNASTFYEICKRVPYTIKYQTYELEEDGRDKLKKIIDMVTKARTNAEKGATDKNNQSSDITTVSSMVNITQNEPNNTASLCLQVL